MNGRQSVHTLGIFGQYIGIKKASTLGEKILLTLPFGFALAFIFLRGCAPYWTTSKAYTDTSLSSPASYCIGVGCIGYSISICYIK